MTDQEPEAFPAAPAAPAGWYEDPTTGQKRWWDGAQWAALPADPDPAGAPTAAPPATKTPIAPLALIALITGGAAFFFGLIPIFGLLLAIAGIVFGIFAILQKKTPRWMPLAGLGGSGIALIAAIIVLALIGSGRFSEGFVAVGATPNATPSAEATRDSTPEPEPTPVAVPNLVGMTVSEAIVALAASQLDYRLVDDSANQNWKVTAQQPAAGTEKPQGWQVELTAAPDWDTYENLTKREFAQLAKDPDSFVGRQVIMWGSVTQFDSATGKCTLRANTGPAKTAYSFDYDVNTIVTAGDGSNDCPVLDPVVQGDHISMFVTVIGAYDYDTAIGGTATAVLVQADRVNVRSQQEY